MFTLTAPVLNLQRTDLVSVRITSAPVFRSLPVVYRNDFSSWEDVQRQFRMSEPEPDEVLVADYLYESYEGSATVLYRNGDTYFYVSASHCSCYGLEGMWEPDSYTLALLIAAAERVDRRGVSRYDFLGERGKSLLPILRERTETVAG